MNNSLPSLYSAEQELEDSNIDNFKAKLGNYFHANGIPVADGLVLLGKCLIREKQYSSAIETCDAALKIINNHPWGIYYKLLALCATKPLSERKALVNSWVHLGLMKSANYFNETAYNMFVALLKIGEAENESPRSISGADLNQITLTDEKIHQYELWGRSNCSELRCWQWNRAEVKQRVVQDIEDLLTTLKSEVALSVAQLSVEEKISLYQIYFYLSKYLSLIIKQQNLSIAEHDRLVFVYNRIASCLYHNYGQTMTKESLQIAQAIISQKKFWQHSLDPKYREQLISSKSPELTQWLEKYNNRLRKNPREQGIYIGNSYQSFQYLSLKEIDKQPALLEAAKTRRKNNKFRLILFQHFFGAQELWELSV